MTAALTFEQVTVRCETCGFTDTYRTTDIAGLTELEREHRHRPIVARVVDWAGQADTAVRVLTAALQRMDALGYPPARDEKGGS